jgi:hypothetical protein
MKNLSIDLTALVSQQIASAETAYLEDPQSVIGWHWWQISPDEINVFDLHPILWVRVLAVYRCYTALIDSTTWQEAPRHVLEILAAARQTHPEWVETSSLTAFQSFSKTYADLSFRDAHACYDKMTWHRVRDHIHTYADEEESATRSAAGKR